MFRKIFIGCLCFLALGAYVSAKEAAQVYVENATTRPAKAGQNSAAFTTIHNRSANDVKLVGASCPLANTVELHRSFDDNGIQKMRPVEYILIPAGEQVVLESGGLHIMLLDLKSDITTNPRKLNHIPITLTFDSGEPLTFYFVVESGYCCH